MASANLTMRNRRRIRRSISTGDLSMLPEDGEGATSAACVLPEPVACSSGPPSPACSVTRSEGEGSLPKRRLSQLWSKPRARAAKPTFKKDDQQYLQYMEYVQNTYRKLLKKEMAIVVEDQIESLKGSIKYKKNVLHEQKTRLEEVQCGKIALKASEVWKEFGSNNELETVGDQLKQITRKMNLLEVKSVDAPDDIGRLLDEVTETLEPRKQLCETEKAIAGLEDNLNKVCSDMERIRDKYEEIKANSYTLQIYHQLTTE